MIAVLFEADVTPAKQARYLALAAELRPLLDTLDGFISIERFQSLTTPGKILSLSWWRDEEAVRAWKNNLAIRRPRRRAKRLFLPLTRFALCRSFAAGGSEMQEGRGDV